MSRRKQAFPVRIEGNRLHLSVEPGSSCNENPKEPDSSRTIQLDECNFNIPAEATHLRPPNILSNGEFVAAGAVYNECKGSVLTYDEENLLENETNPQVILPFVKVEPPVVGNEEQDPLVISACNDSSCVVKDEDICTFSLDETKHCESVIHKEVEKSTEICRNLNVRTSLICKTGTEIKLIQNTSSEKVEVHCVTNLSENTFGVHKKQAKEIREAPHKNYFPETENQRQACTEEETFVGSEEPPLEAILPCVEVDLHEESEPLIISSFIDSVPIIQETGLPTSPVSETEQCDRLITTPEPDSNTILLDEDDLNIPATVVDARSPNILPDGEFSVTNAVCNEPMTGVLTCDESGFPKNETKPQVILPTAKVEPIEPTVILNEEQDSLVISACSDSSYIIKNDGFCTFSCSELKQCENIINVQELKPLFLSNNRAQCEYKEDGENAEICGELNVRTSLIDAAGTEIKTNQSFCSDTEEEQSVVEFTESTFKIGKKRHRKTRRSHKNRAVKTIEQSQACAEQENLEIEESPLQAILPCDDVDPSLLKEEPEPFIISSCKDSVPIIQDSSSSTFPVDESVINVPELRPLCLSHNHAHCDCKEIEENEETCTNLSVNTLLTCETETETETIPDLCTEKRKGKNTRCTRKTSKVRRKRYQKVRRSPRNARASKSSEQNQACNEHENFLSSPESPLQAILPCVDVDPSLLKEDPESLKTSPNKDSVPIAAETVFDSPADGKNQRKSKNNTRKIIQMCMQSDNSQQGYDEEVGENSETSDDSILNNFELRIPRTRGSRSLKPCVTDEEIRCMVDFTKEALDEREKKLQQIREAVYRKRALETDEQRQARLEKDKLRQRKRRAEETEEQREKRLLTMRLHKRIKRSMHSSAGLQKNFLDYYMEEMFKYPETQEEQGSPLNMIVSIDPSWVVRTVEKQQFKCAVETEEQRKTRLEKDMLRQRKKRAEETSEQRAKRLETMRINKRIRRAMETEEQRHRRLEYSRERQLYRRLNETEEQRKERLEREKMRQRVKRASESSEERALRLQAARERMRMRLSDPDKVTDMFDLLSSDSFSS